MLDYILPQRANGRSVRDACSPSALGLGCGARCAPSAERSIYPAGLRQSRRLIDRRSSGWRDSSRAWRAPANGHAVVFSGDVDCQSIECSRSICLGKAQPLHVRVPAFLTLDQLAVQVVYRSEERGRAFPKAFVRFGADAYRYRLQTRMPALKRLALRHFLGAAHHGTFRRIQDEIRKASGYSPCLYPSLGPASPFTASIPSGEPCKGSTPSLPMAAARLLKRSTQQSCMAIACQVQ